MAPAFGPDSMLSQDVPGRKRNQAQESSSPTASPNNIIDAIDTYVPIRVRPRRVTHHQLKPVAAVRKRQRSVVRLRNIAAASS